MHHDEARVLNDTNPARVLMNDTRMACLPHARVHLIGIYPIIY